MERHIVALFLPLLWGFAAAPQFVDSIAAAPVVTPIARTAQTVSGQPLRLREGPAEVVAAIVEMPASSRVALHRHPWSRFVYVESGTIRVINRDTGTSLDFGTGQLIVEAVNQWHEGVAVAGPVRLVTLDLVPAGTNNVVTGAAK